MTTMTFWSQGLYFEADGEGYVYRPTPFSAGYRVSKTEKDALFNSLKSQQRMTLRKSLVALGVIALPFLAASLSLSHALIGYLVVATVVIPILALTTIRQRWRDAHKILGGRPPDLPRERFWHVLTAPRLLIAKQYAIPLLKSTMAILALCLAVGDGAAGYLLYAAFDAGEATVPELGMSLRAATYYRFEFWAVLGLFNALLIFAIALLAWEMRRIRRMPEIT